MAPGKNGSSEANNGASSSTTRSSVVLNNGARRKLSTWYVVILALGATSLYTALNQTSYYDIFSSYLYDASSVLPTMLTFSGTEETESSRPAIRYPNIAPLIPDKNNPIHVVALPDGNTTSESLHVFNDGIEQSPYLIREYNRSQFYLPEDLVNNNISDYNQTNLVWVGNGYASFPGEKGGWCELFEKALKKARKERKDQGLPKCCWHVAVVDFTDHATPQCRCDKVEKLMGREFVHYFKRSIVKGREWNATTQWIDNGNVIHNAIFSPPDNETVLEKEIQVRHLNYPVRTDLLRSVETELQSMKTPEGNPISLMDPIESILERPIDVTHLWNLDRNNSKMFQYGYYPKFRWRISSILTEFARQKNCTSFIGFAGRKDERGRRGVHSAYIEKLLGSKIIVVTQQDRWEDHYRLMEAMVSGAMIITDRMFGLPEGFERGVSIVEFSSPDDLKEKITYYADSKNADERQKIAAAGRRVALEKHRSWHVMEKVIFGQAQTDCSTVSNEDCPHIVDVESKKIDGDGEESNKTSH